MPIRGSSEARRRRFRDPPSELAFDKHALAFRDTCAKIAIVLRQALDGQVGGGHHVAFFGPLLGGVNQQRDFSNFFGQIVHG